MSKEQGFFNVHQLLLKRGKIKFLSTLSTPAPNHLKRRQYTLKESDMYHFLGKQKFSEIFPIQTEYLKNC